jgi:flagellar motor switch/type III secretory pathway protein FliN
LERRILAETMARLLAYGDDLWEEELSFAPTSAVWESAIELCVPGGARVRIVVAAMPFDASAQSAKRAVRLEAVPLRLDAMLQPVRMPIAAMLRWSPGELVPLASARTPHVSLWAGRLRVAQGILGASGPRRAVAVHHIELDDGAAS